MILMAKNRQILNESFIMGTLSDFVPEDHLVRKLDEFIDWDFIYEICDPLYSEIGTHRVDPVVLFKMMFINIIFGYHSMRKTCEEIKVNIAYRWFLGLSFEHKVPDHSTFSQNYARKFKKNEVAIKIFERIIKELLDNNLIDPSVVFVDGTHLKANANKNKYENKEIEEVAKRYQAELDAEIDKDREEHGVKELNRKKKEKIATKEIKVSTSDPDCGYFHKGEKEKCFAYNVNIASDRQGYVLGISVDPGNIHDSVAFDHLKDYMDYLYGEEVEIYVADAGYSTPGVCHRVHKEGQEIIVPKKRTKSAGKGMYKAKDYEYNEKEDSYVCPMGSILKYKGTTKEGRRQYKSSTKQCASCPNRKKCTKSKNGIKVIEEHIWSKDVKESIKKQQSAEGKEYYSLRKITVERDFGDGKRKHGLDYTLYTGYERVYDHTILTLAGMNIKKMCQRLGKQRDKYAQKYIFEHQSEEVRRLMGEI